MITIKPGIRILSGIRFATSEMAKLDSTRTKAVANPIPKPLMAEVVTPSVGHIPSRSTKVGFSLKNPLVKVCQLFISLFFH